VPTVKRLLAALSLLAVCAAPAVAADTKKAAETRKRLDNRIDEVDFEDLRLEDALAELKDKTNVRFRLKPMEVSRNQKITYKAKGQTLAQVLDGMFKKNGLGFYVISNDKDAYDGMILIKQGDERGYEKGKEPKK
jgi:hypothetical protein